MPQSNCQFIVQINFDAHAYVDTVIHNSNVNSSVVTKSEQENVRAIPHSIEVALTLNKANAESKTRLIQQGHINYPVTPTHYRELSCTGPQMILRPEMISKNDTTKSP